MKRTSFFILAAAMIISLCACSEKISCSGDISFSLPRTISSRSEAAGVNQEITVSNYNVTLSQENTKSFSKLQCQMVLFFQVPKV